jgi:ferrous iron transport protein B
MKHHRIALVGTPNAGKTALFNAFTRSNQRVANYSGVTVESAEADFYFSDGELASLVDLPGAYSLRPYTDDEKVLASAISGDQFDGMIIVVDATQPERAIRFLVEVLNSTTLPAVIALNMIDLAQARDFEFDLVQLAALLDVAVVGTIATKKKGLKELSDSLKVALQIQKRKIGALLGTPMIPAGGMQTSKETSAQILSFYKRSDEIFKKVLVRKGTADHRSERIDRIVLHPVWGMIILIVVLGITFQLMFNLAKFPMDWIDGGFKALAETVNQTSWPGMFKSFLAHGVLAGVGGTFVFLPQILILFGLILFLEDFGFMARAVFLLDHWMGKVGLHGRSFLPLLSSYACNIPGILATRTIETRRDRIITTLIIPLTTCSARIPVYTLLIAAFIPNIPVFLGVRLQGLVMLGLYLTGITFSLLIGALLKRFVLKGKRPPLLIELPSYKLPSFESLAKGLLYRTKLFIKRVGSVILVLSIVIWALVSFPKAPIGTAHPIEQSYAASIGHFMEPALKPLGFDWRIGMALIPTFAAREVMVATLSTVYAVGDESGVSNTEKLSEIIKKEWSIPTGLSLMIWFIFAPMCISTLATVKRELRSNRWTAFMVFYLFAFAYLGSFITFRLATYFL